MQNEQASETAPAESEPTPEAADPGRVGDAPTDAADSVADTASPIDQQQSDGAADPTGGAATDQPRSDWPALDSYRDQLRAEHAAWSERLTTVRTQLASVAPALAGIAAQYQALGVEEDLARLREAVLGGAGMIQRVQFDFDLERAVTLAWPAAADPRPGVATGGAESEFRVDLWFGLGPDGRPRVRVEGAKRLEAPLPTSRERLRGALLTAIQAPRLVSRAEGGDGAAPEFADAEAEPAEADGGAAAPTGAGPSATGAAQPAPDSERSAPPETTEEQPVPEATPRPGDPTPEMPPEEMVIPLGPAEENAPTPPKG